MRVLICGDRNWTDRAAIREYLEALGPGTVVIEGDARGADRIAGTEARKLGYEVVVCPAEWDRYGRAAGPIRNQQMLDLNPELVCGFHERIEESKGTRDMLTRSLKAGKVVLCHDGKALREYERTSH